MGFWLSKRLNPTKKDWSDCPIRSSNPGNCENVCSSISFISLSGSSTSSLRQRQTC